LAIGSDYFPCSKAVRHEVDHLLEIKMHDTLLRFRCNCTFDSSAKKILKHAIFISANVKNSASNEDKILMIICVTASKLLRGAGLE
jgi:hypothetical protein